MLSPSVNVLIAPSPKLKVTCSIVPSWSFPSTIKSKVTAASWPVVVPESVASVFVIGFEGVAVNSVQIGRAVPPTGGVVGVTDAVGDGVNVTVGDGDGDADGVGDNGDSEGVGVVGPPSPVI